MSKIGFVGTGAITQAVVTGLCKLETPPSQIIISPRNKDRAQALADEFKNVTIATGNQEVVAESDIVCLALRPEHAVKTLPGLSFRKNQRIVSFISTATLDDIRELVIPSESIFRMVPLPPVANHLGPIALCPPNPEIEKVFSGIGVVTAVEQEAQLYALWSVTAMMAPFFDMMNHIAEWLQVRDIDGAAAEGYVSSMIHALSVTGVTEKTGLETLAVEHSTPGGLNQQAMRELRAIGWNQDINEVLNLIEKRLNGHADITTTVSRHVSPTMTT